MRLVLAQIVTCFLGHLIAVVRESLKVAELVGEAVPADTLGTERPIFEARRGVLHDRERHTIDVVSAWLEGHDVRCVPVAESVHLVQKPVGGILEAPDVHRALAVGDVVDLRRKREVESLDYAAVGVRLIRLRDREIQFGP